MNGFMTVAIAHDATCEPGDEWVFHGMSEDKEDPKGESDTITEEEVEDAEIGCVVFCIMFCVILLVGGIGFWIWYILSL